MFLSCDILEREDEHRYRVKVNKYFQLLDKDCISLSAIDADTLGRNPINVSKAWFGGGYLNMRMELETDPSSNVSHWVNLAYDDERSTADTIRLRLYHNAFGDTIRTRLGAADASFDIRDFVTSRKGICRVGMAVVRPSRADYGIHGWRILYRIQSGGNRKFHRYGR